jgi:hypothetical protein
MLTACKTPAIYPHAVGGAFREVDVDKLAAIIVDNAALTMQVVVFLKCARLVDPGSVDWHCSVLLADLIGTFRRNLRVFHVPSRMERLDAIGELHPQVAALGGYNDALGALE